VKELTADSSFALLPCPKILSTVIFSVIYRSPPCSKVVRFCCVVRLRMVILEFHFGHCWWCARERDHFHLHKLDLVLQAELVEEFLQWRNYVSFACNAVVTDDHFSSELGARCCKPESLPFGTLFPLHEQHDGFPQFGQVLTISASCPGSLFGF